jgi:hypothetical protein
LNEKTQNEVNVEVPQVAAEEKEAPEDTGVMLLSAPQI